MKRAITLAAAFVAAVTVLRALPRPKYPPALNAGEPYTLPDAEGDAVPPEYGWLRLNCEPSGVTADG